MEEGDGDGCGCGHAYLMTLIRRVGRRYYVYVHASSWKQEAVGRIEKMERERRGRSKKRRAMDSASKISSFPQMRERVRCALY